MDAEPAAAGGRPTGVGEVGLGKVGMPGVEDEAEVARDLEEEGREEVGGGGGEEKEGAVERSRKDS